MAVFPLTPYHWAQTMATIMEFTASCHNIILFAFFIWTLVQKRKKESLSFFQSVSVFYFVTLIPYCITVLLLSFGIQTSLGCKYFNDVVASLFFIAKCSLFIIFVEKLFITFKGTVYSFNECTIKASKIILISWMAVLVAIVFISGEGYYVEEHHVCAGSFPLWAHGVGILGDFIIGLVITTTFCRRLIKLQITLKNVAPTSGSDTGDKTDLILQNQKISALMTKFTVLATVSIFTTLWMYIVVFVFELGSFWVTQDTMVNCWCVLCLFEGNYKIYKFMCGPMEKCCMASGILSCCSCRCCCTVTPGAIKLTEVEEKECNNSVEMGTGNVKDTPESKQSNPSIEITTENS